MAEGRPTERLKQEVSENAAGICEYCRSRRDHSPDPFSVEHIHPRARGGLDTPENLALSRHGCDGHKHAKTEALDPIVREHVPLFHPRQERWREHFEWSDDFTFVVGLTGTGRTTVEALQMNRPGVVNLRRLLYAAGLHPPQEKEKHRADVSE